MIGGPALFFGLLVPKPDQQSAAAAKVQSDFPAVMEEM
jgi:hypothetical protein